MSGISFITPDVRVEFGVTTVPRRRRKALYITRGCQCEILGYFTNDENAERFQAAIDSVIEAWNAKEAT